MKTIYTLFIGTQSDKDGNYIPKLTAHSSIESIKREAGLMFDGYTLGFVIGGWNDETGKPIEEHSIRLEIMADSVHLPRIRELATFAKKLLNQSAVLLNQQAVHTEMI